MMGYLINWGYRNGPGLHPLGKVFVDKASADKPTKAVAAGGAHSTAKADKRQGHPEVEQIAGKDGQKYGAGNGKRLEKYVDYEDASKDFEIVEVFVATQDTAEHLGVVYISRQFDFLLFFPEKNN